MGRYRQIVAKSLAQLLLVTTGLSLPVVRQDQRLAPLLVIADGNFAPWLASQVPLHSTELIEGDGAISSQCSQHLAPAQPQLTHPMVVAAMPICGSEHPMLEVGVVSVGVQVVRSTRSGITTTVVGASHVWAVKWCRLVERG